MPFEPVRLGNLGCRLSKILALRCDKRPRIMQIRRKNHSFLTFDAHKKKLGRKIKILLTEICEEFNSEQVQIHPVKLGQKLKEEIHFENSLTTPTDRHHASLCNFISSDLD